MNDCLENACAEGALECGGLTPPFRDAYVLSGPWRSQGGVKPPHSKALRAFSWFLDAHHPTSTNDRFHFTQLPCSYEVDSQIKPNSRQ